MEIWILFVNLAAQPFSSLRKEKIIFFTRNKYNCMRTFAHPQKYAFTRNYSSRFEASKSYEGR